jgi:hypothetical protein
MATIMQGQALWALFCVYIALCLGTLDAVTRWAMTALEG